MKAVPSQVDIHRGAESPLKLQQAVEKLVKLSNNAGKPDLLSIEFPIGPLREASLVLFDATKTEGLAPYTTFSCQQLEEETHISPGQHYLRYSEDFDNGSSSIPRQKH